MNRTTTLLPIIATAGIFAHGAAAEAQDARQASAAYASTGRYSPRLGIYYQLVPYGAWFGAVLTQDPGPHSPLAQPQIALERGDTITHLDGTPITNAGELENHHSRTSVTFVNIRTGLPQTNWTDLPPPGGAGAPGGPPQQSTWSSTYGDYAGHVPPTNARIQLQGPTGQYSTAGGVGQIFGVDYTPLVGGETDIDGSWSFAGSSGWFTYRVGPDGSDFQGSWGFGPRGGPVSGYWRGRRLGGGPAPLAPPRIR